MIVSYLGSKNTMYAHGYNFTDGPVDVPETDEHAIKKFLGNRYFHCDHIKNYVAPKFYVYDIENIRLPNDDLGNAQFKRIKGSSKGKGFPTKEAAEMWVEMNNGKLDQTHYIKKSTEGIKDSPKTPKSSKVSVAIFRKKEDGKPYSKPDKVFQGSDEEELKTQALTWMADEEINPDERLIMVK